MPVLRQPFLLLTVLSKCLPCESVALENATAASNTSLQGHHYGWLKQLSNNPADNAKAFWNLRLTANSGAAIEESYVTITAAYETPLDVSRVLIAWHFCLLYPPQNVSLMMQLAAGENSTSLAQSLTETIRGNPGLPFADMSLSMANDAAAPGAQTQTLTFQLISASGSFQPLFADSMWFVFGFAIAPVFNESFLGYDYVDILPVFVKAPSIEVTDPDDPDDVPLYPKFFSGQSAYRATCAIISPDNRTHHDLSVVGVSATGARTKVPLLGSCNEFTDERSIFSETVNEDSVMLHENDWWVDIKPHRTLVYESIRCTTRFHMQSGNVEVRSSEREIQLINMPKSGLRRVSYLHKADVYREGTNEYVGSNETTTYVYAGETVVMACSIVAFRIGPYVCVGENEFANKTVNVKLEHTAALADLVTPAFVYGGVILFTVSTTLAAWLWQCSRRQNTIDELFQAAWRDIETTRCVGSGLPPNAANGHRGLHYDEKLELLKPRKFLKTLAEIGRGNFSIVRRGMLNGCDVAIKVVKDKFNIDHYKSILNELAVLCLLTGEDAVGHANILKVIGAVTKRVHQGVFCLITEFCNLGSLENILLSGREAIRDPQICFAVGSDSGACRRNGVVLQESPAAADGGLFNWRRWPCWSRKDAEPDAELPSSRQLSAADLVDFARQIADGMAYVHSKGVIHRDLDARNIFVHADESGRVQMKIADFGLAACGGEYVAKPSSCQQPDPKWQAPETVFSHRYTSKTDVWSFGVVLFEVFSYGRKPLADSVENGVEKGVLADFIAAGRRLTKPLSCPEHVYELMLECLDADPKRRPCFTGGCAIKCGSNVAAPDEPAATSSDSSAQPKCVTITERLSQPAIISGDTRMPDSSSASSHSWQIVAETSRVVPETVTSSACTHL